MCLPFVRLCLCLCIQDAGSQVSVDLYEMEDLGAGGSGAAGGLMHPFTPRGKMLWRGDEGVDAALELLDAAEEAAGPGSETIAWRSGLIRPAKRIKHALDFAKFCSGESAKMWGNARTVTHEEATRMVKVPPPCLRARSLFTFLRVSSFTQRSICVRCGKLVYQKPRQPVTEGRQPTSFA
mmetsp:Transcript_3695/g.10651  ORF Transcript_3695/g.10651 Transcript_3695/m.10651 type:complete len:180 (+) Transcript_3695:564-1103(+)